VQVQDPQKIRLSGNSKAIRKIIAEIIHHSGASHIGSCFSVVEILDAVYRSADVEKIKLKKEDRDRVIVSKGHCAAALYVILYSFGLISKDKLDTYHMNNSILSGHVSHFIPFVEHSTGALGHGLSVGVGIGIGFKSKGFISSRVFIVVGDGELHEGSNWEAIMLASHHGLNNLCVLVDNNNYGGIGKTCEYCSLEPLKYKFESFGFKAFEVNGHDENEILSCISEFKKSEKPVAIICHTIKGKGVSFMEDNNVWHYRPPNKEEYEQMFLELNKKE
jgi:transketolase